MSLNLHGIVRSAITRNKADDPFQLIRSIGYVFKDGLQVAGYAPAIAVKGQFQSEGDSALAHADMAGQNSIVRKLYLYAEDNHETRPWGIFRPLARSGDYVLDRFGDYWLVSAVTEDFSECGWVSLRVTLQQTAPTLNIVEPDNGC